MANIGASVAASVDGLRFPWGFAAALVLGLALLLFGALGVRSLFPSSEPSSATESSYIHHIGPMRLRINDRLNEIGVEASAASDIPVELTETKVCCDGLGMAMVRFEAALPPFRIEATPDRIAEVVNVVNDVARSSGLLQSKVTKWGSNEEPLGHYKGDLRWDANLTANDSGDYWQVDIEVTDGTAGKWFVYVVFETQNNWR